VVVGAGCVVVGDVSGRLVAVAAAPVVAAPPLAPLPQPVKARVDESMSPSAARLTRRASQVDPWVKRPSRAMELQPTSSAQRLVEYDAAQRRLWIAGQRCHHGAGGAIVAGLAMTGLAAQIAAARSTVALIAAGGALMVHDWADRSVWFERGFGSQP
jgi:hypothetical protein